MLDPSERLRNAIIEGNLSITKRLLFRFPELWLNIDHNTGWNNLHFSSSNGNYLICFHLISFINQFKDENPDLHNILANHNDMLTFDKLSCLHLAIKNFHLQTLHYLLQEFPGVYWLNHPGGADLQTPLHYCCKFGFIEGLKLLLEKGADYTSLDKYGNNLLHLSFEYGNFECIKIFVKFLSDMTTNKLFNMKQIKSFENGKNLNGWLPIELGLNFKLTNNYKNFKKSLTSQSPEMDSGIHRPTRSRFYTAANNTGVLKPEESNGDEKTVMMNNNLSVSSVDRASVESTHTINQAERFAGADVESFKIPTTASTNSFYINSSSNSNSRSNSRPTSRSNSKSNSVTNLSNPNSQSTSKSYTKPNTNSPSPNKVLSSPMMSVNEQFQKRSHSQSLPTQEEKDIPMVAKRDRANTALEQPPGYFIPPSTPVIKKTPSLKSITISPSMRLNTENDELDLSTTLNNTTIIPPVTRPSVFSTSVSSASISSSASEKNIDQSPSRLLHSASNSTINSASTSNSTTNSHIHSTNINTSPQNNFPAIKSTGAHKTRSRSYSIDEPLDSPSSIAAKIAFGGAGSNSSRSSLASRRDSHSKGNSNTNVNTPEEKPESPSRSPLKHRNSINTISFSRIR